MKIKKTTYGEFNKRFSGFKRIGYETTEFNLEAGKLMPIIYRTIIMYNKSNDYTIIAITCIGYIDLFGPNKDGLTYVYKFDGKITSEELIDKDFEYADKIRVIMEELRNKWKEELDKKES